MTNAELIQKIRAEIERRLKDYWEISFHDTNSYNQDTNVKELKELLSFLSTLESEKPNDQDKKKEPLTFDGYVEKIGNWFANLNLGKFRKTFDRDVYPATALVQDYDLFVRELSEKYYEESEKPMNFDFNYEFSHFLDKKDEELGSTTWSEEDLQELARHFAEWGYLRAAEKYNEIEYNRQRAEESVPNDLEEAAKKHFKQEWNENYWTFEGDVINTFIAGAKWQAKRMKDEEKYLEDEMEKFGERWPYPASFDGYDKDWVDELTEECAKHFYELGKKDMKEQMMKEAEPAEIGYFNQLGLSILTEKAIERMPVSEGDKVRVIIIKEN